MAPVVWCIFFCYVQMWKVQFGWVTLINISIITQQFHNLRYDIHFLLINIIYYMWWWNRCNFSYMKIKLSFVWYNIPAAPPYTQFTGKINTIIFILYCWILQYIYLLSENINIHALDFSLMRHAFLSVKPVIFFNLLLVFNNTV